MKRCFLILSATVLLLDFNPAYAGDFRDRFFKKRSDPSLGKNFHEKTKMVWGEVSKTASILTEKPPATPYKNYPNAEKITLPRFNPADEKGVIIAREVLANGDFTAEEVTLDELSRILFSADGIIKKEGQIDIRTVVNPLPQTHSFSYFHPLEIYLLINRVEGLKKGLYHYSFIGHTLELIKPGEMKMPNCCFVGPALDNAALAIIISAIPSRLTWRYDNRSYRYIYMAAGAVSQNIYLECASLGLGSIATASFHDDLYNQLLGLNPDEEITILLHLIGRVK